MNRVNETEKYLNTLPTLHQEMLSRYRDHLNRVRKCIDENFKIIRKVITDVETLFINASDTQIIKPNEHIAELRNQDLESVS